ncbi:MAG: aldose 1-epimerase [Chitinophagaceae bacterium]|nr:MAG: aldose 1-epimerase [Chitinophagaceae bacterium]
MFCKFSDLNIKYMFSVDTKIEEGLEIIVLSHDHSGTSAEIIPACGAILHRFQITTGDGRINVVDHYQNKLEFDTSVEAQGFKGCKLSPFVCRLKEGAYEFGEKEYRIEKFYLGKHALHGLLYDAPFDVIKVKGGADSASAELLFSYKSADPGFPFKYDCRVLYELNANNELQVTSIIKNLEDVAIPVADGWHPYFGFNKPIDDLQLSFHAEYMLEFDEELIPTQKKLPYAKFQAPEKIEQSIALENLSAAPDAFNNRMGLTTLGAGKESIFRTVFRIVNTD